MTLTAADWNVVLSVVGQQLYAAQQRAAELGGVMQKMQQQAAGARS